MAQKLKYTSGEQTKKTDLGGLRNAQKNTEDVHKHVSW